MSVPRVVAISVNTTLAMLLLLPSSFVAEAVIDIVEVLDVATVMEITGKERALPILTLGINRTCGVGVVTTAVEVAAVEVAAVEVAVV